MILDIENIYNFILRFLRNIFKFFLLYNKKNFFIGRLGFFILFFKKNIKFSIINLNFLEFYKKKLLKLVIIKYINLKFYYKNNICSFNIYSSLYNKSFYKINLFTIILERIKKFFFNLGFSFLIGPDIESSFYNFTLLNISNRHPSVCFSDTFYINDNYLENLLLRTHTTTTQLRGGLYEKFPIKIISFGKVYRPDYDRTHLPVFTQLEFFWIDKGLNFLKLKSIFLKFLKWIFCRNLILRFRSSAFPFTQISFEVDVLRDFKKKNWLELSGMGIINSSVLESMNINPDLYTGLAFGLGVERLLMLYYHLRDLKYLKSMIFEK